LGRAFRQSLPRGAAWGVALPLIAAAYFVPHGWWALAAAALTIVFCRAWFLARLGGVTGDCLGFQAQLAEASALLVLAWR
jgi:cobalamin synthase